jgi:hypothetical protein
MTQDKSDRGPGWSEVVLDSVIALLLPKVGIVILGLVIPAGPALATAGLVLALLAFHLIGKVRGRARLTGHLAKVVGILAALTLVSSAASHQDAGGTVLSLLVLAGAAALGGWMGSRRG